ncbi:hypothetical protein [Parvularcula maris]|uniref:hypothetical protein n=1 Tax=Parvularcula maris TaxID=2965077 RepID=UPI002114DEA7|nr:hypothetical protein [Parvularcula maris]
MLGGLVGGGLGGFADDINSLGSRGRGTTRLGLGFAKGAAGGAFAGFAGAVTTRFVSRRLDSYARTYIKSKMENIRKHILIILVAFLLPILGYIYAPYNVRMMHSGNVMLEILGYFIVFAFILSPAYLISRIYRRK